MKISGSVNDAWKSNLVISLEKCTNKTDSDIVCKGDEEIDDYFDGQAIITLENDQSFSVYGFNEAKTVNTSRMRFFSISDDYKIRSVRYLNYVLLWLKDDITKIVRFPETENILSILKGEDEPIPS